MSTDEEIRLEIDNSNLRTLLIQAGLDKAEQETAKRLMRVLYDELHHRLKNSLAIVTAIVHQSLRTADTIEHGREAVEARLTALSRAHDVLMQGEFSSAKLGDVVDTAIEPFTKFGKSQFLIALEDRDIVASAVLPITLILAELCTNATKYGALSTEGGRVHIGQTFDPANGIVRISWQERNGPTVSKPTRIGFGTRLIDGLASQIHGQGKLSHDPKGVSYEVTIPAAVLEPKTQPDISN